MYNEPQRLNSLIRHSVNVYLDKYKYNDKGIAILRNTLVKVRFPLGMTFSPSNLAEKWAFEKTKTKCNNFFS